MTWFILCPEHDLPEPPIEAFYCTAAQARRRSLPGALDDLGRALGLELQKDKRGRELIRFLSIPQADGTFLRDRDLMHEFGRYCLQDVRVERAAARMSPALSEEEFEDFVVSETINDAGLRVDVDFATAVQAYASEETAAINDELIKLTNGRVKTARAFPSIKDWVEPYREVNDAIRRATTRVKTVKGVEQRRVSMDKSARYNILAAEEEAPGIVPAPVLELVSLLDEAGRTSIHKFKSMVLRADPDDDRVRGAYMWCGASQTARFSSTGLQLHNFVRESAPDPEEVKRQVLAGEDLVVSARKLARGEEETILDILASMLRPSILAAPGMRLVWGDWAGVEARVLPWLARHPRAEEALDIYRRGDAEEKATGSRSPENDPYCVAAAGIYGIPVDLVDSDQRQIGKVACIAEGTLVLTDRGLIPIEKVPCEAKVWDGVEWVSHDGPVYRGQKTVVLHDGLEATEDHVVWTERGRPIHFGLCAREQIPLLETGSVESPIRLGEHGTPQIARRADASGNPGSCSESGCRKTKKLASYRRKTRVYDLLNCGPRHRFTAAGKLVHNCLSLGYAGGVRALLAMARAYKVRLTEAQAEVIKVAWRRNNQWCVQYWKTVETAMMRAIRHPARYFDAGRLRYVSTEEPYPTLWCLLPSGSVLSYPMAEIVRKKKFGRMRDVAQALKANWKPKADDPGWPRFDLYGGLCLAGDTIVLTNSGKKIISEVQTSDLIWDGGSWVTHDGLVAKGSKPVIDLWGVRMTPDHEVLMEDGWRHAKTCAGYNRQKVRLPDDNTTLRVKPLGQSALACALRLWSRNRRSQRRDDPQARGRHAKLRLQAWRTEDCKQRISRHERTPGLCRLALHARSLPAALASGLAQLRRTRNRGLRILASKIRKFLGGYGAELPTRAHAGAPEQQWPLHAGKLPLGGFGSARPEQAKQPLHRHALGSHDGCRSIKTLWDRPDDAALSSQQRMPARSDVQNTTSDEPVFDILNAGPRSRFTVFDARGEPFLVHNCTENGTQSVATSDILKAALRRLKEAEWPIVAHTHDEAVLEVFPDEVEAAAEALRAAMLAREPWMEGLPLWVDLKSGVRYRK